MGKDTKTISPEEMELREKYKNLAPRAIQLEGEKLLKERGKLTERLGKLEGKEGTFTETKKVALRKKIDLYNLAIKVLAEMKYNYIKKKIDGREGSDLYLARGAALDEFKPPMENDSQKGRGGRER